MKQTQNQRLLTVLRQHPVSALEALLDLGIYRAGARVYDLKREGHHIETTRRPGQTAVYSLVK
jgi:hypothetical protein